jgi:hypothetical protein
MSGSQYQDEEESEDDEIDYNKVHLPLPPTAAQVTSREAAGLGPGMGASHYAPGMLHRLAMRNECTQAGAVLKMREGEEFGYHSNTPLVDINLYDNQGMTALHYAAAGGHVDMVQLLLENNADPNLPKQNTGYTSVHFACEGGNLVTTHLLINNRGGKLDKGVCSSAHALGNAALL